MPLNKVMLIGRLGADPELKMTNTNQVPVVNLRIATNEGWTDAQGQKHESVTWHTVVCFRGLATTVAQYMKKGRQVYIEGRLQTREYMGQAKDANGNVIMYGNNQPAMVKKYTTEIVAYNVQFLGSNPMNAYNAGIQAAVAAGGAPGNAKLVVPDVAAMPGTLVDPSVDPAYSAAPFIPTGAPVDPSAVASTFVTAPPGVAAAGAVAPATAFVPPGV